MPGTKIFEIVSIMLRFGFETVRPSDSNSLDKCPVFMRLLKMASVAVASPIVTSCCQ